MDQTQTLDEILDILDELEEEDLRAHQREKLQLIAHVLREPIDINLRVDRCRTILEELDDDVRIDMFVRTQLWNVSALLEQL